jgi:hypothetical protein
MASEVLIGEPAGSAEDAPPPSSQSWRDEAWAILIGALDGALRSYYGVAGFTDDPACVLRIGRSRACERIELADGTAIHVGETIGAIHFWNEQLPVFSRSGPDLRWAVVMHRRVTHSLRCLAAFVEANDDWREMRAFCAEAALSSRIGDRQLRRVVQRYGFECVARTPSVLRQMHDIGECFTAWGLTRVYNPAALAHQRFFRPYHDLWISRATLIERFGHPRRVRARSGSTVDEPAPCRR